MGTEKFGEIYGESRKITEGSGKERMEGSHPERGRVLVRGWMSYTIRKERP